MIIIYGVRLYGKVHARGGQYIATRFFHVYFLPIFPVGSVCVVGEKEGRKGSQEMGVPLDFLSILAAYLRTWAPIVGLFQWLQGNLVLSALLLGLYLLSWVWYGVRGQPGSQLSAGASKSERERQRVEALFRKLRPQLQEPWAEEPAPAREPSAPAPQPKQTLPVLEGTLGSFSEANVLAKGPVVLAWYSRDQWERLRSVSTDAEDLPPTYGDWLKAASQIVMERQNQVRTVDVDVEDLVVAANQVQGKVDRTLRAGFVLQKLEPPAGR